MQGVVVPNVGLRGKSCVITWALSDVCGGTDHEIEQFEDDPLEFIRQDLALPSMGGVDASTRRQAAADVIRALVASGMEADTTQVSVQALVQPLLKACLDRRQMDNFGIG